MEVRQSKSTQNNAVLSPLQNMPLEIITQIVKHINLSDVISLTAVSKIWRCVYLNQNAIWKEICSNLNVREEDYANLILDETRNGSRSKLYLDATSERMFGPRCKWWLIYNHYNMVLKHIKTNDFPLLRIQRYNVDQSYCTDDYIVNFSRGQVTGALYVEVIILKSPGIPYESIQLQMFDEFERLYYNKRYAVNIMGNKRFLVLEIRSIIFVYEILLGEFIPKFWKIIQKSEDYDPEKANMLPDFQFFEDKHNTKIDICDDKLALIHPSHNVIFLINLNNQKICKELVYSSKPCVVDCMKCADERLMIGISTRDEENALLTEYFGIVYHFEEGSEDNLFKVPLFGTATQFKVSKNYIGIENKASATPFITKITNLIHIFWLDCDTFSFDSTRKFIYYNVNQSIFQYDLSKSRLDKFEVTQKIAVDAISDRFSLTPINDRFLLVCSIIPNSFEIFDVKNRASVRSLLFESGYRLVHVGKLSIVFFNSRQFIIVSFK